MSLGRFIEIDSVAYLLAITIELLMHRRMRPFLLQLGVLGMLSILALLVHNETTGRVGFGETTSPLGAISLMFLATVLGIMARYIFHLQRRRFSWLDLLKPIAISPIVLLPLIGSIESAGELKNAQIVSFAFLAFQNGFFWQAVLDAARPSTQPSVPKQRTMVTGD